MGARSAPCEATPPLKANWATITHRSPRRSRANSEPTLDPESETTGGSNSVPGLERVGNLEDDCIHGAPSGSVGVSNPTLARLCPVFNPPQTPILRTAVRLSARPWLSVTWSQRIAAGVRRDTARPYPGGSSCAIAMLNLTVIPGRNSALSASAAGSLFRRHQRRPGANPVLEAEGRENKRPVTNLVDSP